MSSPGAVTDRAETDGSVGLIRTLTLTVFLQWMGATAIVPMLPLYIRHLGGSDALAGVSAQAVTMPVSGSIAMWAL